MIMTDISEIFPYPTARNRQLEIIGSIIDNFEKGKKFVILEAPTGTGKSAIGYTVGRYFESYYYITAQKILQSQLSNDFGENGKWSNGHPMIELKGRNAYRCNHYDQIDLDSLKSESAKEKIRQKRLEEIDCARGPCKKQSKSFLPQCKNKCLYFKQLSMAVSSPAVLMNFHSFIYQTQLVPDRWDHKKLLIIDEAHNTEQVLMDYISLSFSDLSYEFEIPKLESSEEYKEFFERIGLLDIFKEKLKLALTQGDSDQEEYWSRQILKYNTFIDSIEDQEWIPKFEKNTSILGGKKVTYNTVELKPLYVSGFTEELLFGQADIVLMMSATILDVNIICQSLGIDKSEVYATRLSSDFPVENRPIYYKPVGSLSFKNIENTMPRLLSKVEEICQTHANEKGIIHTHTFRIAEYLLQNAKPSISQRFLFQNDFGSKDLMLETHAKSDDTIIIAPAMHEGLDLKEDLSRFQILCKVPFPGLANDPQLKRRMELSNAYYTFLCTLKLVQSYGRSIRSAEDRAITYMLDGCFKMYYDKAYKMLPKWFSDAIIWR